MDDVQRQKMLRALDEGSRAEAPYFEQRQAGTITCRYDDRGRQFVYVDGSDEPIALQDYLTFLEDEARVRGEVSRTHRCSAAPSIAISEQVHPKHTTNTGLVSRTASNLPAAECPVS